MKKNYIAPSTQVFAIETSSMIAATTVTVDPNATKVDNSNALGREDDMSFGWSSGSLFDDEEE